MLGVYASPISDWPLFKDARLEPKGHRKPSTQRTHCTSSPMLAMFMVPASQPQSPADLDPNPRVVVPGLQGLHPICPSSSWYRPRQTWVMRSSIFTQNSWATTQTRITPAWTQIAKAKCRGTLFPKWKSTRAPVAASAVAPFSKVQTANLFLLCYALTLFSSTSLNFATVQSEIVFECQWMLKLISMIHCGKPYSSGNLDPLLDLNKSPDVSDTNRIPQKAALLLNNYTTVCLLDEDNRTMSALVILFEIFSFASAAVLLLEHLRIEVFTSFFRRGTNATALAGDTSVDVLIPWKSWTPDPGEDPVQPSRRCPFRG